MQKQGAELTTNVDGGDENDPTRLKSRNTVDDGYDDDVTLADIAGLNLRAAEKAKELSAFTSVSNYAEIGIGLLPSSKWSRHLETTLGLYSLASEAAGILGRVDAMEFYAKEVIKQKHVSIISKLPVHNVRLDTYGSDGRQQEAVNLCFDVLEQLDCKLPRGSTMQAFKAIRVLMKVHSELNKIPTSDDIGKLPLMNLYTHF